MWPIIILKDYIEQSMWSFYFINYFKIVSYIYYKGEWTMKKQETFSNKMGFILACLGAAIGLGNIWLFPWRLGAYGGAAFLIPYIIFSFLLAKTGMTMEIALGRLVKRSPFNGVDNILKSKKVPFHKSISLIPTLSVAGVFIFYSIVFGWILKYFSLSISFKLSSLNVENAFTKVAGNPNSILWHSVAIIITGLVVVMGVEKGIEKLNKIVMPTLFISFAFLAVISLSLNNSIEGLKYLFLPRWQYLFKVDTWVMALGQAFFSASLNGAGLVLYGGYLKDDIDIVDSSKKTVFFNMVSAILSALVIMPAAFSFGLNPSAGPSLLFITVPSIFQKISGGSILTIIFFLTVVFAALSSAINMLDVATSFIIENFNFSRKKAVLLLCIIFFIVGIPLDLNMNFFTNFSDFITIILAPLGALIGMIAFMWILPTKKAISEIEKGTKKPLSKSFIIIGKYILPISTIVIILLGIIYGGI